MCSKSGKKAGLQLRDRRLEQQDTPQWSSFKRKKRKRKRRVTGVHQTFRKRLTARGLGQKRRAAVCYWKSWQANKGEGRGETERGVCLTLSWSVKASCSFLGATQFHFYLPDTPRLLAELTRSPEGKESEEVKKGKRHKKEKEKEKERG